MKGWWLWLAVGAVGLALYVFAPELAVAGVDSPWQEDSTLAPGELPQWANVLVGVVFAALMTGSLFLGAGFFVSLMLSTFITSLIVLVLLLVTSLI